MKNTVWHQLTNVMAGVALSCGALMVVTPKVEAAVLTYNFSTFGYGSFSFDDSQIVSEEDTGDGLRQTFQIIEGVFNYITVDESANFVPKAYDLAGKEVIYWAGQLLGLGAMSDSAWAVKVYNIEDEGYVGTVTSEKSSDWYIYGSTGGYTRQEWTYYSDIEWVPYHVYVSPYSPIEYTLVKVEPSNPGEGEPIPEPATLFGTALGVGGLMRLKQRKKVAA